MKSTLFSLLLRVTARVACVVSVILVANLQLMALPEEDDEWIRVETTHFTLLSDASKRRTVAIGKKLEQLREVLTETSSGMSLVSPLPTTLYVFKNSKSFAPYNLGADGKPDEARGGYFLRAQDGNFVAIDSSAGDAPFPVIYHEYLHYFLENNVPAIPLWLNEGIAELYSTFIIAGGRAEIGRAVVEHLYLLAHEDPLPFGELFAIDTSSRDYNEGDRRGTFYAQSWALTHFLMIDPERRPKVGKLFALLEQGTPSAEAVSRVYGMDMPALESAFRKYLGSSGMDSFYRYTPEEQFDDQSAEITPLGHRDVLYSLGDLLAHQPQAYESAEEHLRAALALDAEFAPAYVSLAMLELGREHPDEAVALCEKALKLAPTDARALGLQASALILAFANGLDDDWELPATAPAPVEQARERFLRALELTPQHYESTIGLGQTYLFQQDDLDEGIGALAGAFQMRPSRMDVLNSLIILTARSGNVAGARSLLDRALRPRGDAAMIRQAEGELVRTELGQVEELLSGGQADEAIALARSIAEQTQDPQLKRQIGSYVTQLQAIQNRGGGGPGRVVENAEDMDRFNEAVALANSGDVDGAAELLEQLAASTSDGSLGQMAATQAAELRRRARFNRHAKEFNQAVATANSGDLAGAAKKLRALLDEEPDAQIADNAAKVLADLEQALGGRRRR